MKKAADAMQHHERMRDNPFARVFARGFAFGAAMVVVLVGLLVWLLLLIRGA